MADALEKINKSNAKGNYINHRHERGTNNEPKSLVLMGIIADERFVY